MTHMADGSASAASVAGTEIDEDMAAVIKTLWRDAGVQEAYDQRSSLQLNDSSKYFLDQLDRVCTAGYMPTPDDVLRSRVRTSGLLEVNLSIEGVKFKLCDVGGQRSERRKWSLFFADVTAVIFVAAVSEYDQVLFEDRSQNRVVEAEHLFKDLIESRWFWDKPFILFFNKNDMFVDKVPRVPIAEVPHPCAGEEDENGDPYPDFVFGDYSGGPDVEAARGYFSRRFYDEFIQERRKARDAPDVTIHFTTALDKTNVRRVFDTCKTAILRENLRTSVGRMDDSDEES